MRIDPIELTKELIRFRSVTPAGDGVFDIVQRALEHIGAAPTRLTFGERNPVGNLFATLGSSGRHLAFGGHVDVVPPGDVGAWTFDPFSATEHEGRVFGRGAVDMKSGVACFIAALSHVIEQDGGLAGRVSLLITGDEEGDAVNGTKPLVAWAVARGHRFDGCLVGEPTSLKAIGDNAKIGRRGSATAELTVFGTQGHTAYGQRARNAAHGMVKLLAAILAEPIDGGTEYFQPTSLQVTTIDIANRTSNVIPGKAFARFNMRYNDSQDMGSLESWLRSRLDAGDERYTLSISSSGDAFRTDPGALSQALGHAVQEVTGRQPEFSTDGGTSDARFIKNHCPVVEFGLTGASMHQIDEHVSIEEIHTLTAIYAAFIRRFLALNA